MDKDKIAQTYLNYLGGLEKAPNWVFRFTDATAIDQEEFYRHFADIGELERWLWTLQWEATMKSLIAEAEYEGYTIREKLLAIYFTLVQVLNQNRHALVLILNRWMIPGTTPGFLRDFKAHFCQHIKSLLKQGIENGEVETRPLISTYYTDLLWMQCLFLLRVWKNDQEENQATIDEAIERAVNLAFDLLAYTPVDAGVAFTRFIYRNKKMLF